MTKTVLKTITQKTFKTHPTVPITHKAYNTEVACIDMGVYLKSAAADLLQPRSEAVAQLLDKARKN
jgi:hypothetical protein